MAPGNLGRHNHLTPLLGASTDDNHNPAAYHKPTQAGTGRGSSADTAISNPRHRPAADHRRAACLPTGARRLLTGVTLAVFVSAAALATLTVRTGTFINPILRSTRAWRRAEQGEVEKADVP